MASSEEYAQWVANTINTSPQTVQLAVDYLRLLKLTVRSRDLAELERLVAERMSELLVLREQVKGQKAKVVQTAIPADFVEDHGGAKEFVTRIGQSGTCLRHKEYDPIRHAHVFEWEVKS